jgi:non-homologous end joining protein Ku
VEFVPQTKISEQWYDRPYYLGPDGDEKDYFALAEALQNKESEGVAHWVMRNKYYAGALRAIDDYLYLFTLRDAKEVILADDLTKPSGAAPTQKELAMAKQLVEMLQGEFNPKEYKDEYRERVMEFIEKKAKGHAPRLKAVKPKRQTAALDNVLAKSIESLRKKDKRAARASSRKREEPEEESAGGRPFWSGTLTFGLVSVPVSLFPAARSNRASLRMLGPDGQPLARRYYAEKTGKDLDADETVRGFEIDKENS